MGRRADIQPRWLVSLLHRWALHDVRVQLGTLGYASASRWMFGLKSSPASSVDPTGYSAGDFRDVEAAMNELREKEVNLWAAVSMYYKAWTVDAFRAEGFPFNNSLYYERLHRGHARLAETMNTLQESRRRLAALPTHGA